MKYDYIIGIDPDVDRSGYAMLDMSTKHMTVDTATLPTLIDCCNVVQSTALATDKNLVVYVEAGWLDHSNWHLDWRDSKERAAAKGKAVGRNHQRGMDIIEMLMWHGIKVIPVKPLKKIWRGRDKKITHDELVRIVGEVKHTNQEGRDAALIAWVHAGLPLKI